MSVYTSFLSDDSQEEPTRHNVGPLDLEFVQESDRPLR